MGCSGSKQSSIIASSQMDGPGLKESCRLITELRSRGGLVDLSALIVDGSTGCRKLKYVISENPNFSCSVIGFLDHVIMMPLRSLTATKLGIEKVRSDLETVRATVLCFEEEEATEFWPEGELLAVASPNTHELRSACEQQLVLLGKLSRRKHKLGKNLRWAKKWQEAWTVIYTMSYIVVFAGSVVLAALAAPPAATVATTVVATSMKSVEPWFNSMWDEYESTQKAEMEVVAAMEKGRFLLHEFMSILSLMEMVEMDVGAMLGMEEGFVEAVATFGIGNIKSKIGVIEKSIDGLDEKVDCCISEIRKVGIGFLKIITEDII